MSGAGGRERRLEVIPSIDLRRGRVVRLVEGRDDRATVYDADPAELVARFLAAGARTIHVVDLDAAFGEPAQRGLLAELISAAGPTPVQRSDSREGEGGPPPTAGTRPTLQLGGGLRDQGAVESALELGFDRGVLGSMLVRDFELFEKLAARHPGRLVPALDCREGTVRHSGWAKASSLHWKSLSGRLRGLPCPAILVTDVARDGGLGGANVELASGVGAASGIPAIVSGGVASIDDVTRAGAAPWVGGVILGRALHEGRLALEAALEAARPAAPQEVAP